MMTAPETVEMMLVIVVQMTVKTALRIIHSHTMTLLKIQKMRMQEMRTLTKYGMKDIYLGVPVVLGKNGIEKIIEVKLDDQEKELLATSAKAVKSVMTVLDDMKMF